MNIELSRDEYRRLLDILHLADVVLLKAEADEAERSLIQKMYAHASQEGFADSIGYDHVRDRYIPTWKFERTTDAHERIEQFSNNLFWDQLVNRLTMRDAAKLVGGIEQLNAMTEDQHQEMEAPIRERYIQEFSTNGLTNLTLDYRGDLKGPSHTSD